MTRPIRGWAEQDAFTGWRHLYCYLQRAGVRKAVKRRANRRDRRDAKAVLRRGGQPWR